MYTLKEILDDHSPMPEPIIKNGILLDKTMLVIVGPPKSKKTFLAQKVIILKILSQHGIAVLPTEFG